MHSAYSDPTARFVYACDLGTDEILVFHQDPITHALVRTALESAHAPSGAGPRHIAFALNGEFLYANNEMANSVSAYQIDGKTGSLTWLQTESSLPVNEPIDHKSTAEIKIHPNGKWLYVSNRGHNSIAVFQIRSDGRLVLVEIHPAGVLEPRGFDIDPSGNWLVVAGQNSNQLKALSINPHTGKLGHATNEISVSAPACVAFSPH